MEKNKNTLIATKRNCFLRLLGEEKKANNKMTHHQKRGEKRKDKTLDKKKNIAYYTDIFNTNVHKINSKNGEIFINTGWFG